MSDFLISAIVTLLVTLDPPGLAPIFVSLTYGMNSAERKRVAIRACIIAFFMMTFLQSAARHCCNHLASAFRLSGYRAGFCCSPSRLK